MQIMMCNRIFAITQPHKTPLLEFESPLFEDPEAERTTGLNAANNQICYDCPIPPLLSAGAWHYQPPRLFR